MLKRRGFCCFSVNIFFLSVFPEKLAEKAEQGEIEGRGGEWPGTIG
jgi:hypothetical protein